MFRHVRWQLALICSILLVVVLLPQPGTQATQAQIEQRCFVETDYCISGRIREFWEQNGGLPIFGLPITPQQEQVIEGQALQVQWFERNRFELHPENAPPYDVLLGRLGGEYVAHGGLPPRDVAQQNCRYFEETGFNVCGTILMAWRANGLELDGRPGKTENENLALFGYPVTGQFEATLSDGNVYQVQWFERARFELHPQNAPPHNVLLGLLGTEMMSGAVVQPSPTGPEPSPSVQPSPEPSPTPEDYTAIEAAVRAHIGDIGFEYTVQDMCIDREFATARGVPVDPNLAEMNTFVLHRINGQWVIIYDGSALTLSFRQTREGLGLPEDFQCLPPPQG